MINYTTLDLITAVQRIAHVPQAQVTFQPADFLALADSAMLTMIAPEIVSVREGYWTTHTDFPITNGTAVNQFAIPSLALGSALIEIKLLIGDTYLPIDRIEISELVSQIFTPRPNFGMWIEDNMINVLPNGGITGSARLWYSRMPSQLVLPTACAQITAISGDTLSIASLPLTFQTTTELDVVSSTPGFNVIVKDTLPLSLASNQIVFPTGTVPSRTKVGDYVSLSGQSCVVQCPREWIACLEQATACKIYESQGYLQKLKAAEATFAKMVQKTLSLISPREVQKTKYIPAGGSVLGANRRRRIFPVGKN